MTSLTTNLLFVIVYVFILGTSLYLLGYGIHAGLIKRRILNDQNQASWTGGPAIGIGIGFIIAGILGLYACQYYLDGVVDILKAFMGK